MDLATPNRVTPSYTGTDMSLTGQRLSARVTVPHLLRDPQPLRLTVDEAVFCLYPDPQSIQWWRVRAVESGEEGWIHDSFLYPQPESEGISSTTVDYFARELTTTCCERLFILAECDGWYWAENQLGESGWLPVSSVELEE